MQSILQSKLPATHYSLPTSHAHGYVALISVLVVGAVGTAITLSLILLGLGSARTSFAIEQMYSAKALANACAEEGLEQIRNSTPYTGTGNLALGSGTCTYTVASQGGSNRTVEASGTVGTAIRKVKAVITAISPTIVVSSWQELSDF